MNISAAQDCHAADLSHCPTIAQYSEAIQRGSLARLRRPQIAVVPPENSGSHALAERENLSMP